MSFCGYNPAMARSLEAFAQGVAAQVRKRALEEGVPLAAIPALEVEEISIMIDSLERSPKKVGLEGVLGLAYLVRSYFRKLQSIQEDSPGLSTEGAFDQIANRLNKLMFAMEDQHKHELKPRLPKEEAIRGMIAFCEEHTA